MLGILKTKIFCGDFKDNILTDKKYSLINNLNCKGVEEIMPYFIPYVFQIDNIRENEVGVYSDKGEFIYPEVIFNFYNTN